MKEEKKDEEKWQRANLDFDRIKFLYEKVNKENTKLTESCKKEIKEILSQKLEADNRYHDLVSEREKFREKERILLNTFDLWKSKFDSMPHEKKQKSQAEKNSYECDKCVYEATTYADLTEHKNNNHAEEEIKCEQCGLVVTTDANLKGHMEAYHEETRAETDKIQEIYMCDDCDEEFAAKYEFETHMKECHDQIQINCDKCEYVGGSKTDLEIHRQTEHYYFRYFCCECDYETLNKDVLKKHKQEKHADRIIQTKKEKVLPPPKCNLKDVSHSSLCCDRKLGVKKPVIYTHDQRALNGICTDWNKGYCAESDLCKYAHTEIEACRYANFCSRTNCRFWHDFPSKFPFLEATRPTRRPKW